MSNQTKILIAVGLQIVLVLAIPFYKNIQKENSSVIFLEAQPADPIDPLRGHFIRFTYPRMSNVYTFRNNSMAETDDSLMVGSKPKFNTGQDVYVRIWGGSAYFGEDDTGIRDNLPPQNKKAYLKGTITGLQKGQIEQEYIVTYGIEDYFIPEDKTPRGALPQGQWKAKIRVDENRVGTLEQMYLDNTPWP